MSRVVSEGAVSRAPRTGDAESEGAVSRTPRTGDAESEGAVSRAPRTGDAESEGAVSRAPRTGDAESGGAERTALSNFNVPDGYFIELLPRQPDHVLLRTKSGHMMTIDFGKRGIRIGFATTGRFLGEEWNKSRKKYGGRGWKQALVDDAVAHFREVGL